MSDRKVTAYGGIVIGTAGHIDHGKTSLIGALTGINTDRLAEEKKRGISIDLGFAHFALPSGRVVSFVDVPGHERFVRNMLAGAGGIEAVLLVVAANESIKPQTVEHFEICRLLGIERGLVALTKSDLVSTEQLTAARAAVRELTGESFLRQAPVIAVSAISGHGLDELTQALEELARQHSVRDANGFVRLPVDRSFAPKGFGTVVTGTLWSGSLRTGDMLEVQPAGLSARVRSVQVHGETVAAAGAGQRVAVNLSGIEHDKVARGATLVSRSTFEPSSLLHVRLDWLGGAGLPDTREQFLFHSGTSETGARLSKFDSQSVFARIKLNDAIVAVPGDRFILRRPSPAQTVAGGSVIDAFPPKRLSRAKSLNRAKALATANLAERIALLVKERALGRTLAELCKLTGKNKDQIAAAVNASSELLLADSLQRVVSRGWLANQRGRLLAFLRDFHAKHPGAAAAPIAQARLGLDPALASFVHLGFASVRVQGDTVALATHRAQVSPQETEALRTVETAFRKAGYEPPPVDTVPRNTLEKLIKQGTLVRISEKLVFHADVVSHICTSLSSHRGRRFSIPEFKSWTQISRKYAIPLLEYLDHQRITRREGEYRVVL